MSSLPVPTFPAFRGAQRVPATRLPRTRVPVLFFSAIVLAFSVAFTLLVPPPAGAATLRGVVTVDADIVRLGDLFDDAGANADLPVLRAPAPGKRYVLEAAWLAETARVHQVAWRPQHRFERVVVERTGRIVGGAEILGAVRASLEREGAPAHAQLELAAKVPDAALAIDAPPRLEVQSLAFDAPSGRFSAVVIAGAGHPSAQRVALAGRVVATRAVWVPRRAIGAGEVIRRDDLVLAHLRADALRPETLHDLDRLVGLSPRQRLSASQPVREGDVRAPVLVARNANVTIVLQAGNMTLTAAGKALDDGARGETVRVLNLQSRKTIEAAVTAPDTVAVAAPPRFAFTN